jgi:hypothetical protein
MAGAITAAAPTLTADTATVIHDEPQTTAHPAAEHSTATPPQGAEPQRTAIRPGSTRVPARGSDDARRPANPTERSADLRARYRNVLNQTLALPSST